jgi:putative transposase
MKMLKLKAVSMTEYETYPDVLTDLPALIEEVYNTSRLHSALGYLSPFNVGEAHARTLVATEA